jgi:hypothetical protein
MNLGLKSAFNRFLDNRKQDKENKQRCKDARAAIAGGDLKALTQSLEGGNFSQVQADDIFLDAIESDNVAIFNCVLEKAGCGGPNRLFYTVFHNPHFNTEEAMLYTAINRDKANVALALAENPVTDIRRSGMVRDYKGYRLMTPTEEPYKTTPLELARERGMTEVVSVLARRTLELRQAEFAQLQKEAKRAP